MSDEKKIYVVQRTFPPHAVGTELEMSPRAARYMVKSGQLIAKDDLPTKPTKPKSSKQSTKAD